MATASATAAATATVTAVVKSHLPRLLKDRSVFHWHGVAVSPSHALQHELSVLLFRQGYRWFPLLTSEWRGGQHELDPLELKGGVEAARRKVVTRQARRSSSLDSHLTSTSTSTRASGTDLLDKGGEGEAEEEVVIEARKDVRESVGFQPMVQTTRYFPEDAVEGLASKWINPLLLWQLSSFPTTNPYTVGSFSHAYFGVMQYYREFLTLLFQRPTFVLSSVVSGRIGQYDATFVANYIRHMIESEIPMNVIFREVRSALTQSDVVRTVQHGDRTHQYTIRGVRVRVIGRTHDTIAYDRLKPHRMYWPVDFIPTKHLVKFVEFALAKAQTKNGKVGVKVWIYLDQPE